MLTPPPIPDTERAMAAALAAAEALNELSAQLDLLALSLDELAHNADPALRAQVVATATAAIERARARPR